MALFSTASDDFSNYESSDDWSEEYPSVSDWDEFPSDGSYEGCASHCTYGRIGDSWCDEYSCGACSHFWDSGFIGEGTFDGDDCGDFYDSSGPEHDYCAYITVVIESTSSGDLSFVKDMFEGDYMFEGNYDQGSPVYSRDEISVLSRDMGTWNANVYDSSTESYSLSDLVVWSVEDSPMVHPDQGPKKWLAFSMNHGLNDPETMVKMICQQGVQQAACTEPSDATKVGGLMATYKKDACSADQLPAAGCCTKLVDMPKVMSSPLKSAVTATDTVKDVCPCTCAGTSCTAASCVEPAGEPGSAGAMIASINPQACTLLASYCHIALDQIPQADAIPADVRAGVYVSDICPCTCGTSSGTTATPGSSTVSTAGSTVSVSTANPYVISGSCTAGHDVCATLLDCTLPVGQKKSANLGECTIDGNESQKVTCVQDGTLEIMIYSDQTCTTLTQTMEIVKAPSSCINNVMADWDGLCGGNDTADYPSSVSSLATLFAVTILALFMI